MAERFAKRTRTIGSPGIVGSILEQWFPAGASVRIRSRMVARHAALGLALVVTWLTLAPIARAQTNLQWDAPPDCPQRQEVLERIRALAGSSFDTSGALSAEGKIARVNGRFWLTLLVRDGPDVKKRVIASDSCADLAGAAAITVALLLGVDVGALDAWAANDTLGQQAPNEDERNRSAVRTDATPDHDERRETPREPTIERAEQNRVRSESAARSSSPPSKRRWNVVLRAPIVTAELGPLPDAILGVGLGFGMRYQAWRVLLTGQIFQRQTVDTVEPADSFGADVQRMAGQLVACRGWRSLRFEIAPCIGAGLEYLSAAGFGEGVSAESRQAVWPSLGAGAVAHWYTFKYLALFVGVTGYLELSRPRLVIAGIGEIQQLAPAAAGVALGLEWIL